VDLNGKRVLVVGLGKSGVASALFLKSQGAQVTVSDAKSQDQLQEEIPLLLDQGIAVETGGHGERTFRGQDLIVVSPGVPVDAGPLVQARALGETVIGEIELAARFFPGPIVAITGSNGKTTTTTLAGEIATAGGHRAVVGGNIGTPAVSLVQAATPETVAVLEISSFQLETIDKFRHICVSALPYRSPNPQEKRDSNWTEAEPHLRDESPNRSFGCASHREKYRDSRAPCGLCRHAHDSNSQPR